MNATVSPEKVKEVLDSKRHIFGGKYLIVLAEEGTSQMPWDGQNHLTRKLLLQGCDAVFSANENSIKWHRGELDLSPEQFRAEYKSLKPCLHGSDAHRLDRIGRPDNNKYCWIKADSTFEGLKQILYEPGERVWIGPQPARLKNDYQTIESIRLTNAPAWFDGDALPLNRDLVTVVGGRGSGKSALAELIAFAGGSKIFGLGDTADTFLKKASKRSDTNSNPIEGLRIELRWNDGRVDLGTVGSTLEHGKEEEKVKYLPQKFVETLCAPDHTRDLQKEIEKIIFHNLPDSNRAQAADFQELREQTTKGVLIRQRSHEQAIHSVNSAIGNHVARIAQNPARKLEREQKRAELEALQKEPPSFPQELKQEMESLEALTRQKQELESQVAAVNERLNQLAAVETKVQVFSSAIAEYNRDVQTLLARADLVDRIEEFAVRPPDLARKVIDEQRLDLKERSAVLRDGDANTPFIPSLTLVEEQLNAVRQKLYIIEDQRKEHERYLQRKSVLETAITNLDRDINEVAEQVEPALNADVLALREHYCDQLDALLEEKILLEELYRPLKESLAHADATAKKLGFYSRLTFDAPKAAERLMGLLDQRGAVRDQTELEALLRQFSQKLEDAVVRETNKGRFDREAVKTAIAELHAQLCTSADGGRTKRIEDQLRKSHSKEEFDNELFSLRWFRVAYALLFDGKQLELLSPGERGIVLLLLYLEAERTDTRPLIIDQPEDNLDNMSVYPSLVEYFRKRKRYRQIIIITHNPNLVVNTDSEQVIVPGYDGGRTPRIVYRSGSLENTSHGEIEGIRESVCKVLEGGREAFRRREEKYAFPT
jgi:AAA domain